MDLSILDDSVMTGRDADWPDLCTGLPVLKTGFPILGIVLPALETGSAGLISRFEADILRAEQSFWDLIWVGSGAGRSW